MNQRVMKLFRKKAKKQAAAMNKRRTAKEPTAVPEYLAQKMKKEYLTIKRGTTQPHPPKKSKRQLRFEEYRKHHVKKGQVRKSYSGL